MQDPELLERQLTAADQLAQAALVERKREGWQLLSNNWEGVQQAVLSAKRTGVKAEEVEQLSQRMADSRASVDDTRCRWPQGDSSPPEAPVAHPESRFIPHRMGDQLLQGRYQIAEV